ncbi:MAG: C-GCAxxG-C-C family protein [Candidatus Azobacteroides sp.]|nr:C-GCAxxG-C-C family protein [Candidatus Azobacteroides sp.]
MEKKSEKAIALHQMGYNCAQAVFAAFADVYNLDEETALRLSTPFAGGMAGTRNICGAVTAMGMVSGLEAGSSTPKDTEGKNKSFLHFNTLMKKFEQEYGSLLCKHLRGIELCQFPVKIKPCREYVRFCAELVEEAIENNKK